MNADNTILSAALVTLGSTTAASVLPRRVNRSPAGVECVKGELPSFKMLIGQGLVFAGLGIIAPAGPKMAAMFATLIGATAATYYGLPILSEAFGEGLCKAGSKTVPDPVTDDDPSPYMGATGRGADSTSPYFTRPTTPSGKVLP